MRHLSYTLYDMNTPVISLRANARDARLIRRIAKRLRLDPGLRLSLESLVAGEGVPRGPGRAPNRGSYVDEAAALAAVVDRLVATLRPLAVHLFGSRATGRAGPDSDFDLLVVLKDGEDVSPSRCYAPLLGSGVGCDVAACTASEFASESRIPGTICHEAARRGRLLYGTRR